VPIVATNTVEWNDIVKMKKIVDVLIRAASYGEGGMEKVKLDIVESYLKDETVLGELYTY
jgi:hypothetical protein